MAKKQIKKQNKEQKKSKLNDISGLFIPAGLFIGMGIGFVTGQLVGALFIGLGCGFLGMILAKKYKWN
ncbi:hypothetical protein H6503_06900 [Candidatus Woesearchaeota archaeon]|nr:hypothetical protein [Candidatus Woesearchaeota archaeon]